MPEFDAHSASRRKLHEWLFLLLRFAISHDPADRSAAHAIADELDSLGLYWRRPAGPRFFSKTSREICAAILAPGDNKQIAILRKHTARIEDMRLRRAFLAALDMPPLAETVQSTNRAHLWVGLSKR